MVVLGDSWVTMEDIQEWEVFLLSLVFHRTISLQLATTIMGAWVDLPVLQVQMVYLELELGHLVFQPYLVMKL